MKRTTLLLVPLIGILLTLPQSVSIAGKCSVPPFILEGASPLVMLVMERDHKLYYQAYNDASDLDKDGRLDIGYKHSYKYSGYFDPNKCYHYEGTGSNVKFVPKAAATGRYCSEGSDYWSGNFLNWLSMSRMDMFRKVLYGGHRVAESVGSPVVLEGVYIPQDAHSWGKEYDGNDTGKLTPFAVPDKANGKRHLFCMTSTKLDDPHIIRVALSDSHHKWDWASTERAVCSGPATDLSPATPSAYRHGPVGDRSDIQDFVVRVQVCDTTYGNETNCKNYAGGGGVSRPTGIFQKYAESEKGVKICSVSHKPCNVDSDCDTGEGICVDSSAIYLGLVTGSYTHNLSGGVLRKNVYGVTDEINQNNGMFQTSENVQGNIILTLDRMKTVGFNYSNYSYASSSGSSVGYCDWITTRPINEGECRMWGNPIGEMLYETLRYLGDQATPTDEFKYTTSADSTVNLSKPDWGIKKGNDYLQPYGIFPPCSKPTMIVISDVNPNYDSNQVPGAAAKFSSSISTSLPGLNTANNEDTIGSDEGMNGRSYFVGESGSVNDFVCTSKSLSSLSTIRGLCPEEPTKQGSYTAPAVAYYGKTQMRDQGVIPIDVDTMTVALSSPVPDIKIKVGNSFARVVPIGKSVSGCYNVRTSCADKRTLTYGSKGLQIGGCSDGSQNCTSYCPSNQIVNFYVQDLTYDGNTTNLTNAKFLVNFEDVEQGADHDMDSMVYYTVKPGSGNTLNVTLDSNYGAGCIDQAIGFVISGTTEDGVYLPVKDGDVPDANDTDTPKVVANMPKHWTKVFSLTGNATNVLQGPLWYAAKWGGFVDADNNKKPNLPQEWDIGNGTKDVQKPDGIPDTYFQVNNADELYQALSTALDLVLQRTGSAGAVATVTQEFHQGDVVVRAAFESFDITNPRVYTWFGHLESYLPYNGCPGMDNSTCHATAGCTWDDTRSPECNGTIYSFQKAENIHRFCAEIPNGHCVDAGYRLKETDYADRSLYSYIAGAKTSLETVAGSYFNISIGISAPVLADWVQGSDGNTTLRDRHGWKLGDIVYSTPVVVGPPTLASLPQNLALRDQTFTTFVDNHKTRDQVAYVGANDGLLHAFKVGYWNAAENKYSFDPTGNATLEARLGLEAWGYIPSNLLSELQWLASKTYGQGGVQGCVHRSMVDLSPQGWNCRVGGDWKTVLLGGERGGGDTYFALDVTDPSSTSFSVLWEFPLLKNFPVDNATRATYVNHYSYLNDLPFSWSVPTVGRLHAPSLGNPYVAFFGGGIHEFEPGTVDANSTIKLNQLGGASNTWKYLYYPTFHAVGLGNNTVALHPTDFWQPTWTTLLQTAAYTNLYPVNTAAAQVLPYAVSSMSSYDLFDSTGRSVVMGGLQDGFTDLIYGGDMNGTLYQLVLNSAGDNATVSEVPRCMVRRKVKPVPTAFVNPFRGPRQPITVMPVAALDTDKNLRVYFGTGKFDDAGPTFPNDRTDNATMTFYCLKQPMTRNLQNSTIWCGGTSHLSSPLTVSTKCAETPTNATRRFRWSKVNADNSSSPDGGTCFECMFDLTKGGERVVDSALVAGGLVFFTTFVPKYDVCAAGGEAYLYVLDYMCRPLEDAGTIILQGGGGVQYYDAKGKVWTGSPTSFVGAIQVDLGGGLPSRPVLDSSGNSIIVQLGDARMLRIGVQLPRASRSRVGGWTRDSF